MVAATIKGGFWEQYGSSVTLIQGRPASRRRIRQLLGTKGNMALREKIETLNGATSGSAASKTLARIEANSELGGKRTIETETLVSANTAAADITEVNDNLLAFSTKTHDPSPVVNGDGNPLGN